MSGGDRSLARAQRAVQAAPDDPSQGLTLARELARAGRFDDILQQLRQPLPPQHASLLLQVLQQQPEKLSQTLAQQNSEERHDTIAVILSEGEQGAELIGDLYTQCPGFRPALEESFEALDLDPELLRGPLEFQDFARQSPAFVLPALMALLNGGLRSVGLWRLMIRTLTQPHASLREHLRRPRSEPNQPGDPEND